MLIWRINNLLEIFFLIIASIPRKFTADNLNNIKLKEKKNKEKEREIE